MKRLFVMLLLAFALFFGAHQASALVIGGPGFYVDVPPHVYVGPHPGYWTPYYGPSYPGPGIVIGVPVYPRDYYHQRYYYHHRRHH